MISASCKSCRKKPSQGKLRGCRLWFYWSGLDADNVRGLETFGTLQQIELHRFALVKRAISIFLDGRKMDENVFPGGALNETVAFRSIEPLYCALLSHK